LSNYTGKYNLVVNAEVSSQIDRDYGYATITENTERVSYNKSNGRFIYISGVKDAQDYITELQGGKKYYLHLGFYKDANASNNSDRFMVNNIHVELSDSDLCHRVISTNSLGQAITQIPFGKYELTELKAPDGYDINQEPTVIEFRSSEGSPHEFTITNNKKGRTIVHHYIKGTETKLAEDQVLIGRIKLNNEIIPSNELKEYMYETVPHLDFKEYELEKDIDGNTIIPENANGEFTYEDTIVTYYYVPRKIPLIVNHFVEGTNIPVLLSNGEQAESIEQFGNEGENYITEALKSEELSEKYELVEVPDNYLH
jgi:hypothetical protein